MVLIRIYAAELDQNAMYSLRPGKQIINHFIPASSSYGVIRDPANDIWDNNMPITNVATRHIIGYKYFGFGGLDQDKNGLKASEGTKPGNNTKFNLFP